MKNASFNKLASAITLSLAAGLGAMQGVSAQGLPTIQPGVQLPSIAPPQQIMDARCPNATTASYSSNSGLLSCKGAKQTRAIVCSDPAFPRLVVRQNASGIVGDIDVCAANTEDGQTITTQTNLNVPRNVLSACPSGKTPFTHSTGPICVAAGLTIGASQALSSFATPRDYVVRTNTQRPYDLNVDYVRAPLEGRRNGFSYVQGLSDAQVAGQGWRLDLGTQGAVNQYQRTPQVSAILVPHTN